MTPDQIKQRIQAFKEGTQAQVRDLTGTQDHIEAVVVSEAFEGVSKVAQHKMIMALFTEEMTSGEVHALSLRTYTPEQFKKYSETFSSNPVPCIH